MRWRGVRVLACAERSFSFTISTGSPEEPGTLFVVPHLPPLSLYLPFGLPSQAQKRRLSLSQKPTASPASSTSPPLVLSLSHHIRSCSSSRRNPPEAGHQEARVPAPTLPGACREPSQKHRFLSGCFHDSALCYLLKILLFFFTRSSTAKPSLSHPHSLLR